MKMRKRIGVLLLCMSMIVSMLSMGVLAASGSVSVSSSSGTVGSTVSISCTATISGGSIGAADVVLTYDASALQLVSSSSGANGGSGRVDFSQAAQNGGSTSLGFSMQFKILKEGNHSVSVSTAEIYDWDTSGGVATGKSGGTITGKAETTGDTGNSGNTGDSGNSGNTGDSGSTGNSGNSGNSGSTGNSGNSGNSGNTGNSGNSGNSGSTGNSGNSGNSGNTGNDNNNEPEKDSNSKLSGLQVYPGNLSPAFSANTTSYTVNVTDVVESVTITGTAQSDKASVRVSGGTNIKVGSNGARVIVTAEDGSTTVYNITIICERVERITIDETEYTVNVAFTNEEIPEGFVRETLVYNEKEYEGLSHEKGNLKLLCLQNPAKASSYFIYDQETASFYPYMQLQIVEGKHVIPLPIYETVDFSETTTLTLQERQIEAWKIDDEFSVIPVMTAEGENLLYKYDSVDGTYQRYSEAVPEKLEVTVEPKPEEEAPTILEEYGWYIIAALGTVIVILLFILIYISATKSRRHRVRRRRGRFNTVYDDIEILEETDDVETADTPEEVVTIEGVDALDHIEPLDELDTLDEVEDLQK